MKREMSLLLRDAENKLGKKMNIASDIMKLWHHLKKNGKLSPEALDKLALFAGFQNWKEFQDALKGNDDGQTNYEG
jgi:hypothetical protein